MCQPLNAEVAVEDVTDDKFDAVTDGVGEKNVDCDKERDTG